MLSKKNTTVLTILTALGAGYMLPAQAADLASYQLDPMVITATRTNLTVKEAPVAVEVINQKKLQQTQAKTLHEALRGALGVNIFNDFQGRSNVSIRGSESRHVLILVDGKRLGGELSYNSANAWEVDRIRMEDVERIEIIRGPAGALYGSDAMGGVINVITKTPDKELYDINYEYGWYEDGKGAGFKTNLYLQGAEDKWSYKLATGINSSRPYLVENNGKNDEANFYGQEKPISLNVGYELENGNQLLLDFARIKEDTEKSNTTVTVMGGGGGMSGGMTPPTLIKTSTIINDNTRTDYSLTYQGNDEKQHWRLRAYQSVFEKDYASGALKQMIMGGRPMPPTVEDPKHDTIKRTLSVIEGQDSWSVNEQHRLTSGFEWRRDNSEGTRLKKESTPLPGSGDNVHDAYDEAYIDYASIYLQDEFRPNDKWLLIPSIRYEWNSKFDSEIVARMAATYNAADDVRVKLIVGQGYKTPTVNELYHYWEMFPQNPGTLGQFFVGNLNLQPEKSINYEISLEKDWGSRTTSHLGFFRTEVKDLIEHYYTGFDTTEETHPGLAGKDNIMSYRNVPEATLQGIELYGSHKLAKDFYLNAGYLYLDAKNKTEDSRLQDRAKHQITFGLSYQPENIYAWDASLDIISNLDYYYNDTEKGDGMGQVVYSTKNFTIANIMTSKHLTKDMKIYLGIDNISNHQNFGQFADGNLGRLYRLGMEYKF